MPYETGTWRAPDLRVDAELIDDRTHALAVTGEIDVSTVEGLHQAIMAQVDARVERLIVDIEGVAFIDSTAMAALAEGRDRLVETGGMFALVAPDPHQQRLFHLTALSERLRVSGSRDEAIAALDDEQGGGTPRPGLASHPNT
jgi:anti-sigma B factor antagonist